MSWVQAGALIDGDGGGDPTPCPEPNCSRDFLSRLALEDHMAKIHGRRAPAAKPRRFHCRSCSRSFQVEGWRDRHERTFHAAPEAAAAGPSREQHQPAPARLQLGHELVTISTALGEFTVGVDLVAVRGDSGAIEIVAEAVVGS